MMSVNELQANGIMEVSTGERVDLELYTLDPVPHIRESGTAHSWASPLQEMRGRPHVIKKCKKVGLAHMVQHHSP